MLWSFSIAMYLIFNYVTTIHINIVLAPSETQCNHQGDFHDYNIHVHRFCNVKNRNKIYENKDITLSLCGE